MRVVAVRLYVVLLFFCIIFPVPELFAQQSGNSKQVVVLSSRYKFAPQAGQDMSGSTSVRLVGLHKSKSKKAVAPSSLSPQARWAALPIDKKISAQSVIVMDGVSGDILYAQHPDLARQPASTIKVLTGILAIENLRNSDMISPSRHAAGMPRSKIYLNPRKSYAANDLINAVLLASANDASVALAEKVSGSERKFAALMTAKAKSLGARNTICKTATGLTSRGQQSTARDLAIIFNKAMEGSEFARRVGRSKVKTGYGKLLWNHNKALWQVHGAEGGKTGYTRAARQTYVGKFKREQGEVVVALMGSETMWDDVKNLVEYGFAQQERQAKLLPPAHRHEDVSSRLAAIRKLYADDQPHTALRVLVADSKNSRL